MYKVEIENVNGKWLINGKPYDKLNIAEKQFFDEFLLAMKWEYQKAEFDKGVSINQLNENYESR